MANGKNKNERTFVVPESFFSISEGEIAHSKVNIEATQRVFTQIMSGLGYNPLKKDGGPVIRGKLEVGYFEGWTTLEFDGPSAPVFSVNYNPSNLEQMEEALRLKDLLEANNVPYSENRDPRKIAEGIDLRSNALVERLRQSEGQE